jgi:hypothetical protein
MTRETALVHPAERPAYAARRRINRLLFAEDSAARLVPTRSGGWRRAPHPASGLSAAELGAVAEGIGCLCQRACRLIERDALSTA